MISFSGFITLLLHPISIGLMGFLIIKIVAKKRNTKIFYMFWILLGLTMYIFSTSWLLSPLVVKLEDKFPVFSMQNLSGSADNLYIMVLGSGGGHDSRLPPTSLLSPSTLSRLVEGIRIARLLPQAKLVTSARSKEGYIPLAFTVREAAILLGIDSLRIIALPHARNTQEEAADFVTHAGKGASVIVCTSAIHMPRAMEWFRQAGAKPIAAPCDFIVKKDDPPRNLWALLPQPSLWKTWQHVLKEYVGAFYFKVKRGS